MSGQPTRQDVWWPTDRGLVLRARLTPRAAKDAIEGLEDTAEGRAVKARVRALPENGAANTALARLVADWLSVPKTTVAVTSGAKSRIKVLTIQGDPGDLEALIEKQLSNIK